MKEKVTPSNQEQRSKRANDRGEELRSKQNNDRIQLGTKRPREAQSGQNGDPFVILDEERERYESLKTRTVVEPSVIDYDYWVQARGLKDPFATRFLEHIETLKLVKMAKVDIPASRALLVEFFTSFEWVDNETFTCRLNGNPIKVNNALFTRIYGFPCRRDFKPRHEDYNEGVFWKSIKSTGEWEKKIQYALTYVDPNDVYMVYRFFTRVVLDKDDPGRMSGNELYLFWCLLHKPSEIQLCPFIAKVIKARQSIKAKLPLCLGTFVNMLAQHHKWKAPANDLYTPSSPLVFGMRTVNTESGPISVKVTFLAGTLLSMAYNRETTFVLPPPPEYDLSTAEVEVGGSSRGRQRSKANKHTVDEVFDKLEEHSDELRRLREDVANCRNEVAIVHELISKNNELLAKLVEQRSTSGPEPQAPPPPAP